MGIEKLLVGLTGNICSGKSTAAQYFKGLGAYVIDTDKVVRDLYKKDVALKDRMILYFGAGILDENFRIDRAKLGEIVYKDRNAMKRLESLVWPKVSKRVNYLISRRKGVIIIEAPMLYESGLDEKYDKNILIMADKEDQLQRLMKRKKITLEEALTRIDAQMSQLEKQKKTDYFIWNTGTLGLLKNKVEFFYNLLEVHLWFKKHGLSLKKD